MPNQDLDEAARKTSSGIQPSSPMIFWVSTTILVDAQDRSNLQWEWAGVRVRAQSSA